MDRASLMGECNMSDKVVCWFQVPLTPDGSTSLHPNERWTALEKTLLSRFGGLTRGPDVFGAWLDPSKNVVSEASRTYEVDVDENRLPEIRSLLSGVCSSFGQRILRSKIQDRAVYFNPDASQVLVYGLLD
jgi:hypothetical protein